ncbi:MAG: 1-deoxy-D-xylulose-5-phosphate synthase [Gammaproteobacteria bacterium RIFCSPHIGHO2_12_FULL_40_19]|nr:MAG: 1-deoxy-D-xylulose-5-phosphate synthase [Gammaproteobacteria bacterium RIFCSPHIGHO2_12_FULL_40_19]
MSNLADQFPLLSQINDPKDLRQLPEEKLPLLAAELRSYLIDRLDQCGGHFAANLGTIELTIALHYVYQTPEDRLIWDVGHQAYPHKILTGRRDLIHTVRQANGLAPFPKRDESVYDCFGTGHSSTSIGAALGMAVGAHLNEQDRKVIAIIGDGGLTGGQAFEALNHGGAIDPPNMLVILNDNEMSISENVGALSQYLGRILSGKTYATLREGSKKFLAKMPPISRFAKKTETHLKGMLVPGTLFEELGFNYIGPIDGHDLTTLIKTLRTLKTLKGAKLLHIITTKGKGYAPAEAAQIDFHAVKPGFYSKSSSQTPPATKPTYSDVFGEWLCDTAAVDSQLIGITPAMREGSGMVNYAKQFPDRYFDVGIAEQHALTFAAGLACENKKPVVAIYSTFLQRAYDQLIHDIALQNLDVTFGIDRAGLVGADGPTHAGSFDLSFLRCIPNMVVMAPSNENECRQMLTTAYHYPGPAAVRYPRGTGTGIAIEKALTSIPIGKAVHVRHGEKIALLVFGSLLTAALSAAEMLDATVINMRFVKPLDENCILTTAASHELLVTLEENTIMGGAGSAVSECLSAHHQHLPILHLGLPDLFLDHGNPDAMLAACGLKADGILRSIQNYCQKHVSIQLAV